LQKEMGSLKSDMSSITDFLKNEGTNPVMKKNTAVSKTPSLVTKKSLGQYKQVGVNDLLSPMSTANDVSELYWIILNSNYIHFII